MQAEGGMYPERGMYSEGEGEMLPGKEVLSEEIGWTFLNVRD